MEVLLVLAILVVLGSLVTVSFVRMQIHAYQDTATSQCRMLEQGVELYVLNIGSAPTQEQGLEALLVAPADLKDPTRWKGPYLNRQQLPSDPWNHPYQYEPLDGAAFRIWSNGRDGRTGTEDDISTTL